MFFANLGHNVCDGHAGHMKRYFYYISFHPVLIRRQVRKAEKNWKHMYSIKNVLPCMSVLKNTTSIELSANEVNDADEDIVKPVGKGFVRQFHHFKYAGEGVVLCQ